MKKFTSVLLIAMSLFSLTDAKAEKLRIESAESSLSSYQEGRVVYSPSNVYDGDYTTKFWSFGNPEVGSIFTVTLSEPASIGEIKIYFDSGDLATDGTVIEVSPDNSEWVEVGTFNGSEYASSSVTLDANGVQAKYVRLRFTQPSDFWFKIMEFEVYGRTYVAPSRTISAVASPADGGTVTVNGVSDAVTAEGDITLAAVAAYGYKFVGWTVGGEVVSTSAEIVDEAEGDKEYVAVFEACANAEEWYAAIGKPSFETAGGTHLVAGIEFAGVNVPGFDYVKGATSAFRDDAFAVKAGETYSLVLTYELHWGDIALFQIDRNGTEKRYGYYICQWEANGDPYTILGRNAELMCEEFGIEAFADLEKFTSGETTYVELPYKVTISENHKPGDIIVLRAMVAKGDKGAYDAGIEEGGCLDILLQVADIETGIDEITDNRVQSTDIYDLTGRRIESITAPGIYIVGGKKVLVK